jgi:outer membrane protein assembly factor BamB
MKTNYLVTGLCVGLLIVMCIAAVSAGSDIQIEGTYRELWNHTLDGVITTPTSTPTVIAIDDISCDGKVDVIMITQNDTNVTLVALCGKNGTQLWDYNITGENPYVYVYPVDDMTCDGKTDFIVRGDYYNSSVKTFVTTLIGLGGKNGTELWNETITSTNYPTNYHSVRFYPVHDLSCDNKTDIILEIEITNGSYSYATCTVIAMGLVGQNGSELWRWTKTKTLSYASFSMDIIPVDDMTCDGKNDVVITIFDSSIVNMDTVYVLDGTSGTELWNETCWTGRMDVYTVDDLNCDNKADVILDKSAFLHRNLTARMGDGTVIWQVNIANGSQNLLRVDDLTGDGKTDLIKGIAGGAVALAGNNGSILWERNDTLDSYNPQVHNVGDLSCDGKPDVILSQYRLDISTVLLKALNGTNGADLWNYSVNVSDWVIPGNTFEVISVADMDCDGKNDILLDINLRKQDYSAYQGLVIALSGKAGTELWRMVIPFEYGDVEVLPVDDVTCDGKTDIILNIYDVNYTTFNTTITVMALVGMNGTLLWEENVTGGYNNVTLEVYFGGDFSCDNKTDIILVLGDSGTQEYKVKVKEGKTGWDVITFSSNTSLYPAVFFRYQVLYSSYGFPDNFFWEIDTWARYDMTCENISDLVVGGGREVYAITKLPCGDSSEDDRTIKNTFFTDEDVYAIGSGFEPLDWIIISVVLDRDWGDGASIPTDVSSDGVNTVQADANGSVFALVWPQPLTVGAYDIVFDADQNGVYNAGTDAVDSASPGFVVQERPAAVTKAVPVLTTLGLGLLMVFMVLVAVPGLKRRPEKK